MATTRLSPRAADGHGTPRRTTALLGFLVLGIALALNWYLAAETASQVFSWTSLSLFVWLMVVLLRWSPAAFILLLPFALTRAATLVSLMVIEGGAYMPEVNQSGAAGDASASFVFFQAVFFLTSAMLFRLLERPALAFVRSPLLDRAVALLAWPVLLACMAWGAAAFLYGVQGGFPLLEGVDRFLYRREYSSPLVFLLLDNKFLVAALLGAIAFTPRHAPLLKTAARLDFLGLTGLYFLFGDKFFTILVEAIFFVMPLLLQRRAQLGRTLLTAAPLAVALICGGLAATVYIYSGYGRLPIDRTMEMVGARVAGQGELWFVANRDAAGAAHWDGQLVDRYVDVLDDENPAESAFVQGIETHYFIQRYAPTKLAENFRKSGGWVQFTMGTEAMALVMFGYVGVAVTMALGGLMLAFAALYLLRGFASGFPLTLFFAVWTYLQVYFAMQQASLWPVAADGQVKRLLLFLTIELVLLAVNRGLVLAHRARTGAARMPAGGFAHPA